MFSRSQIQPDEFEELEETGKVRAHESGLKATVKPTPSSPLEREILQRPISTALGLQALENPAIYRPQNTDVGTSRKTLPESSAVPVPVPAPASSSRPPIVSDAPLSVPPKQGARRYWLFGPRE